MPSVFQALSSRDSHFIAENTEAQRVRQTCLKSPSKRVAAWGVDARSSWFPGGHHRLSREVLCVRTSVRLAQ